ncbi:hypothetical protein [Arcanobacterium bovis]|uniref:Uncharacterized protein n=1 Tax=Arcanobacterium bovis TaxID=2529275 RepID=A0A4Q9V028_9ACTO|nr:hypothetical protein [Arcanobacterium bovis]TBW20696.1 hypothetical protein EZJ44_08515 [Arcanobacterium bovis]
MDKGRSRTTDPLTSHIAGGKLKNFTKDHGRILKALHEFDTLTDSELEELALRRHWPMSGKDYYRRRRSDLKTMNLITATDQRRANPQGNLETAWALNIERKTRMETQTGASFDEGNIIFIDLGDDTYGVKGKDLQPGAEVKVSKKNGGKATVIIDEIIDEEDGVQTATFTWPDTVGEALQNGQIIFTQTDNGEWLIKGYALIEGEEVEVTSRNGKKRTVIVGAIHSVDEDGLQTAAFENVESDMSDLLADGRIIFIRDDGEYLIKGKGLVKGSTVKVTKANGKKVKVTVGHVISDENGIQTATFTSINKSEN